MARTASVSRARAINTLLLFAFSLVLSGCGGLTGDGSHPPQPGVVITPVTADVRVGDTEQFSAIVTDSKGVTGGTVKWFVEGKAGGNATVGTISEAGVYKAPTVLPNPPSIHVTATSTADATLTSEAMVSLQNPVPTVSAVQPSPISVGDFTITVTGTKFVKGAQVQLGSSALTTTFVSATQLTAKGTATQSQVGKADLVVKNPDPGAVASAPAFSVQIAQPSNIKVAVVPASVTLRVDTKQQFTASVTGSSNTAVTWAVNDIVGGNGIIGTIDAKGMYTPPGKVPNPASVKVTAKSSADTSGHRNFQCRVVESYPYRSYSLTRFGQRRRFFDLSHWRQIRAWRGSGIGRSVPHHNLRQLEPTECDRNGDRRFGGHSIDRRSEPQSRWNLVEAHQLARS